MLRADGAVVDIYETNRSLSGRSKGGGPRCSGYSG